LEIRHCPRDTSRALVRVRASCALDGGRENDEHASSSFSVTCVSLGRCCSDDRLHTPSNENCAGAAACSETRRGYRGTAKTPTSFGGGNSARTSGSRRSFRLEPRALPLELHGCGKRPGSRLHLVARSFRRTALSNVSVDQRKLGAAGWLVGMDAGVLAIGPAVT
jgi:hypothetical protein